MLVLDVLIRYPTIALLLLFAGLALRDGWRSPPARYAAFLSVTLSALLLGTAKPELQLPHLAQVVVRLLDVPSLVMVWWLGRSMFEDDFRLDGFAWAGFGLYCAPVIAFRLRDLGLIEAPLSSLSIGVDFVSYAMMAHLAWVVMRGRRDDLVEPRRRFRAYFILSLILAAIAMVVGENLFERTLNDDLSVLRAVIALPLVLWGLFWLTRFSPELLSFEPAPRLVSDAPGVDPRDKGLCDRLTDEMTAGAYNEQGLTIAALAERLSTPEHRLRAVINGGLGYRNFSSYLNSHRIAAAKAMLSDPQKARLPILTIAMDVGFGSLAPFNRAFKASEGQTPSEYRRNAMTTQEFDPINPEKS